MKIWPVHGLCFLLLFLFAVEWCAGQSPATSVENAKITIDASHVASYTIPRSIYGSFLEPIGNSIYGGLWAEAYLATQWAIRFPS